MWTLWVLALVYRYMFVTLQFLISLNRSHPVLNGHSDIHNVSLLFLHCLLPLLLHEARHSCLPHYLLSLYLQSFLLLLFQRLRFVLLDLLLPRFALSLISQINIVPLCLLVSLHLRHFHFLLHSAHADQELPALHTFLSLHRLLSLLSPPSLILALDHRFDHLPSLLLFHFLLLVAAFDCQSLHPIPARPEPVLHLL